MQQMTLTVGLREELSFDNYLSVSGNKIATNTLKLLATNESGPLVGIQGAADTGKSHLLNATCASFTSAQGWTFLPLKQLRAYDPKAVLADLEHKDLVAIDDIDCVFGDAGWEHALFDFFNRITAEGNNFLFSLREPLSVSNCLLPDLTSRLKMALIFSLVPLSDEQLEEMLVLQAKTRGIGLKPDIISFILKRHSRRPSALIELLDRLAELSLIERKAPSLALVKKLID